MSDVIFEFIGIYEIFGKENQGFLKVLKCLVPFFTINIMMSLGKHNGLKLEK